ncbi:hypothetical protein EG829_11340 [bacterium]|nr:hypothetical protein [bacterium]
MHAGQDTFAHGNLTPLAHKIYTNDIYVDKESYLPWRVHSTMIWTQDYVKRFLRGVFRSTI